MSVVFFGTPRFAVPSLEALLDAGEEVAAVVTRSDKRRGRGGQLLPSAVKAAAQSAGVTVLQPPIMKDEGFIREIISIRPEFLVVVAFGRILGRELLDAPSIAPVNLHASLLPRYRGAAPISWAIIDGERETGITTMRMAEGLDEGDILLEERLPILDDDTTDTLSNRLALAGGPLLLKTLRGMRDGSITPVPQHGEPSYARMLTKEDGLIKWERPARELAGMLRGVHPWPGGFFPFEGGTVKVLGAYAVDGQAGAGMVESVSADSLVVGTGRGLLALREVQPEGKRPMSGRAFAVGRGIRAGRELK